MGTLFKKFTNRDELTIIAGPCAIESLEHSLFVAAELKKISEQVGFNLVFKSSFDKANRSSIASFRGPGIKKGLAILDQVSKKIGVPVISDIHVPNQAAVAAEVLDIIQIPAFLCRQTDLLIAAAKTGKPVAVKKGQFLSPNDMKNIVDKLHSSGCKEVILTERGATFGYNNLVVDMRSIPIMRSLGCPVIFDATHSVQLPGGQGTSSGGQREFVPILAKAAVVAGADAVFLEVHDNPSKAPCDGPNMIPLEEVGELVNTLKKIKAIA